MADEISRHKTMLADMAQVWRYLRCQYMVRSQVVSLSGVVRRARARQERWVFFNPLYAERLFENIHIYVSYNFSTPTQVDENLPRPS